MHYLEVIAGPDQGRTFSIEEGETITLGRGQASSVQINDPRISRVHCLLAVENGQLRIMDQQSTGGTLVDSHKILDQLLSPGSVIQIGDSQLRYRLDAAGEHTTLGGNQPPLSKSAPSPKVAPVQDLEGHSLGPYLLEKILAAGNSGMVFRAKDKEHNRRVAVKVLTPDVAHSEEQKERFVRAMKTMLPIQHPHIVRLLHAGKSGPYCWAAMEYIDGESMTAVIDRIGIEGMLDWREAYRVAVHIGRALAEAHERKIIHRNVTPPNILRRHADRACLLGDLMLAKALEGTNARQITRPGQLIGEAPYMSPERTMEGAAVDGRSDLYGLGATLYALLTGKPPFESDSLPELIRLVRSAEPAPPKQYQLSIADMFQDVVLRMLAKRPEDRYQNPTALLADLERVGKYHSLEADWAQWVG